MRWNSNQVYAFVDWVRSQCLAKPFKDKLRAIAADPAGSIREGRILVGTAAGEISATYNGMVGATQADALELVGQLLRQYDRTQRRLAAGMTEGSPSQNDIVDAMLKDIDTPATEVSNDFRCLRSLG